MDTVSRFTRVYGDLFIAPIEQVLMCLSPYLAPESTEDYKNVCIATIAEIAQELKDSFKPYAETFLPLAMHLLNNTSEKSVKHNAIYCCGLLVTFGRETCFKFYEPLCQSLSPVFNLDPIKYNSVIDNACGTIARMINCNPSIIPIDQVCIILI